MNYEDVQPIVSPVFGGVAGFAVAMIMIAQGPFDLALFESLLDDSSTGVMLGSGLIGAVFGDSVIGFLLSFGLLMLKTALQSDGIALWIVGLIPVLVSVGLMYRQFNKGGRIEWDG
jgi:hypothetical protein